MENNNNDNNNNNNNNEKGHDHDIVASTSGTADQSHCSSFPAGYRFVPTDDELITHYLSKKVKNEPLPVADMREVKLYSHPPHELAGKYTQLGDKEWYFFTPRDRKYPKGYRPRRSVGDIGYWKATGAEKPIKSKEGVQIGNKTSLVFYYGKPKSGQEKKTNWIMHEYKLHTPSKTGHESSHKKFDDYALCKIYEKAERLNKKQNDQEIIEEKIEDPASLHIPDNNNNVIDGMDQNHEQLAMMANNNGYGESNYRSQPQNHQYVAAINVYGDNSHQFQPQNHQHGPINGYRDHTHQFQTQNHGYVPMLNCNRDQTQQAPCGYNQQQVDFQNVYRGHNRNYFLEYPYNINSNFANLDDGTTIMHDDLMTEWQQLVDFHNVYQGHNGNNVEQDHHGINSNFGVDEVQRANPNDQQRDLQQGNNIGNNSEQDTDDIIRSKSEQK
ncbi:hypothetical protein CASFOL_035298 [Castilleja foliolosa]|uniref:NAC domain-containing protein n=1 Tax=Castilleja foliolosa TaxID=1961234 RepID=A0ABD3BTF3_9LAMI